MKFEVSSLLCTGRTGAPVEIRLFFIFSPNGFPDTDSREPLTLGVYFRSREDKFTLLAHVAKLADAYVSEAYGETHGGSIPLVSTFSFLNDTTTDH